MKIHYLCPRKRVEDGYGTSSEDLANAFEKLGVQLEKDPNVHRSEGSTFSLIYGPPKYADAVPKDIPYGIFTMWESEKPPMEWKPYLEKAAFVANPSEWGCETFRKQYGLKNIVHVPLAYNSEYFYDNRTKPSNEMFTFLSYNSGFSAVRKGFIELVEAFKIAFSPDDPVRLIVKSSRPDLYGPMQKIAWEGMRRDARRTWDNMEYLAKKIDRESLANLCRTSDCFVFPSRGEGFGITPLEAMATGTPCVISWWAGMSEYFNEDAHYRFAGNPQPAEYDNQTGDFGDWRVADTQDLALAMRAVYENQEAAKERAEKGKQIALSYSYEKTAKKLLELIQEHAHR